MIVVSGAVVTVLVGIVIWREVRRYFARRALPPGPPGNIFFGNLFDWPKGSSWITFDLWKQNYGPVIYLRLLGQDVIITTTLQSSRDIVGLSKNADRPRFAMAGELMGFSQSVILAPYDAHWKLMRKLIHQAISRGAFPRFWPYLEQDVRMLVDMLVDDPSTYRETLRYILGRNILQTTYGITVDSPASEYITVSEQVHHDLSFALIPGSFFVDILPFLKYVPAWFPGAGFKNHAAVMRDRAYTMTDKPYLHVKRSLETGTAPPSFVSSILENSVQREQNPATLDSAAKWSAASLYGASTESLFASLSTFFLAMAMLPEIQQKAQWELDTVIGQSRLPSFADIEHLPYVGAVLKETLRWHPPIPTGIAHRSMEDQHYQGYYIPAGATIIPNLWSIGQDSALCAGSHEFSPERFLKKDPELDPVDWCFGFGRRNCPGIHYATSMLYIVMACVLSAFDITVQGEVGRTAPLEPKFSDTFISYAESFPCQIRPRSVTGSGY